jgi:hypothetical protein
MNRASLYVEAAILGCSIVKPEDDGAIHILEFWSGVRGCKVKGCATYIPTSVVCLQQMQF